jgi:multiple antibiotic resistance protein
MDTTYRHFLLGIFAVANNFPALGVFLGLCDGLSKSEQKRLAFIATASAFITMLISLFAGQSVLSFFGISIDAFRATGGVVLCLSGIHMLGSGSDESNVTVKVLSFEQKIPAAIVPIGIPLTTGAGTIATITIFAGELKLLHKPLWGLLAAIITITALIYIVFRYSTSLVGFLGHTGMNVLTKITGLFTMAIGIQFIFDALISVFPGLK